MKLHMQGIPSPFHPKDLQYEHVVVDQYSFILEWPFIAEKRYLSRIFRGLIAKHGPTTMSSQHEPEHVIVSQNR